MIIDLIKKNIPEYKITLPTSKKKYSFRPLLVKEEKYFSIINNIASTFEDKITNLCSMVNSCFDDKVKSLNFSVQDFQFAINSIRQKSIGETTKLKITCPYTKEPVVVNLDLNDVKIESSKKDFLVKIKSDFIMKFRCPRMSDILSFESFPETEEEYFDLTTQCLTEIQTPSETIQLEDVAIKEKREYVELIERKKYKLLKEFICNSTVKFNIKYKSSDGIDREIEVNDFVNFLKFYLVILTL